MAAFWYRPELYDYLRTLDALGWCRILLARKVAADLVAHWSHDANRTLQWFWAQYYLPNIVYAGPSPRIGSLEPGSEGMPEPFHEIHPNTALKVWQDIVTEWQQIGNRIIVVDPDATDAELREAFESWLKGLRKSRFLTTRAENNKPRIEVTIEDRYLRKWQQYNVPGVLDRVLWARLFGTNVEPACADWTDGPFKRVGLSAYEVSDEALAVAQEAVATVHGLACTGQAVGDD